MLHIYGCDGWNQRIQVQIASETNNSFDLAQSDFYHFVGLKKIEKSADHN